MKRHWLAALALVGGILLSGCAVSRPYKNYTEEMNSWSYPKFVAISLKDWGLDLVDVVSLEVGGGENIGIVLQPTEILQTGFLFGDVMKFGWRNRGIGFYREVQGEGGAGWAYYRSRRFEPIIGTEGLFNNRPRLYDGFPIRDNDEWHWMDFGGDLGVVFVQASAHASPKQALDFLINTLGLPFDILLRYPLSHMGAHIPEIDVCDDDTAAVLRRKYELELIKQPEGFEPTEKLNELWEVPY